MLLQALVTVTEAVLRTLPGGCYPTSTSMTFKRRRYYSPNEVASHNLESDCWVSLLGKVFDLTDLVKQHKGVLAEPILKNAGKDITHWFDPTTGDVKRWVDPLTGLETYYTPQGRFVHIPPSDVRSDWDNNFDTPWWKDYNRVVGNLSKRTRFIRIVNTLTQHEHTLEVCSEETMEEILDRYLEYNAHGGSYTWKFMGQKLAMEKTLEENGVADESEEFYELSMEDDFYIPAIHLYYNDDLTIG